MGSVLPYLLVWLQEYGYPILWLAVFISATGIPLPTSLVLLAAGAFAASGDFSLPILIPVSITAFIAGDNLGYLLGRLWGSKLLDWLETSGKMRIIKPRTIIRSRLYFNRLGGWAIFFSRFLVSALGGAINILAGAERYPYRRFVLYDACGETVGASLPIILGYIFGASWDSIGDVLGSFSLLLLATLISLWLAFQALRIITRMRKPAVVETEMVAEQPAELIMVASPLPHADTPDPSSGHLPL
jgi:membrane-associated protein